VERIDGYALTELELLCMASLTGMKKIYGYEYKKSELLKKEIHYALYGLAKKKYIYMEEKSETICISSEMKDIFDIIKNMQNVYDIMKNDTYEKLIIYKGSDKKSVFIRQSSTRDKEAIVGIISSDYVVRFLLDEGYIRHIIMGEGENIVSYEDFRENNREDKLLSIKKINKEYNIEETKIVEVYESYIVGIDKGRIMKLTKDNLEEIFR
jgi:hypothetical protein